LPCQTPIHFSYALAFLEKRGVIESRAEPALIDAGSAEPEAGLAALAAAAVAHPSSASAIPWRLGHQKPPHTPNCLTYALDSSRRPRPSRRK
jgi:hypothetical protein